MTDTRGANISDLKPERARGVVPPVPAGNTEQLVPLRTTSNPATANSAVQEVMQPGQVKPAALAMDTHSVQTCTGGALCRATPASLTTEASAAMTPRKDCGLCAIPLGIGAEWVAGTTLGAAAIAGYHYLADKATDTFNSLIGKREVYHIVDPASPTPPNTASPSDVATGDQSATPGVTTPGTKPQARPGDGGATNSESSAADEDILPAPQVENPKLQNIVRDIYKGTINPSRVGTGTTADALRNETETGEPTGGKYHTKKANEYSRALRGLLKGGKLSEHDRIVAQSLLDDLQNALGR